jgi:hypothetical protein
VGDVLGTICGAREALGVGMISSDVGLEVGSIGL